MKNLVLVLMFLSGCSSPAKNERSISDFAPETLRVRRPNGPAADPKAEPGMPEFESAQKPNAKYDCQYPHELFSTVSMPEVRSCLNELYFQAKEKKEEALTVILYRLKRQAVPYLEVEDLDDPKVQNCLKTVLPKIPVPREIMYMAADQSNHQINCYSSGLDIDANQWMGLTLPIANWALKLRIPLPSSPDAPPATDDELRRTLITWALTPFRDEKGKFRAKIVPDAICRQCLGEKGMLQKSPDDAFFWPGP